jgi:hypothetical protein
MRRLHINLKLIRPDQLAAASKLQTLGIMVVVGYFAGTDIICDRKYAGRIVG